MEDYITGVYLKTSLMLNADSAYKAFVISA